MQEIELRPYQAAQVEAWAHVKSKSGDGECLLNLNVGQGTSVYQFKEGLLVLYWQRKDTFPSYIATIMLSSCQVTQRLAQDGLSLPKTVMQGAD